MSKRRWRKLKGPGPLPCSGSGVSSPVRRRPVSPSGMSPWCRRGRCNDSEFYLTVVRSAGSNDYATPRRHPRATDVAMAWEKRGNRSYYYRKRREGHRIISEYMGCGQFVEAIATLDALDRERRAMERKMRWAELHEDRGLAREVDAVCGSIRALASATLVDTGFRTHKGQWRKKRGE